MLDVRLTRPLLISGLLPMLAPSDDMVKTADQEIDISLYA